MTASDKKNESEGCDVKQKNRDETEKNRSPSEFDSVEDKKDRSRKSSHRKDKKEKDRHTERGREREIEKGTHKDKESRRSSRRKRRRSYSSSRDRKERKHHSKRSSSERRERSKDRKKKDEESLERDKGPVRNDEKSRDSADRNGSETPKEKPRDRDRNRREREKERERSRRRTRSRSRSTHRNRRSRRSSSRSRSRRHRRSSSRSSPRGRSRRSRSRSHSSKKRTEDKKSIADPPKSMPEMGPTPSMITQLMKQHPTASLQDILARMQMVNSCIPNSPATKPARELYVGNLPPSVTGPQLQEFLGTIVQQVGMTVAAGNPILSTWVSSDGHYAFCEFRSVEECNNALMLNGLQLLGQALKCGRPKSYTGPPQPPPVLSSNTLTAIANLGCIPNPACFAGIPGLPAFLPSMIPDPTCKRIIMMNIPQVLTEDQVRELVSPFGELKSFTLVNDAAGKSSGNAIFEYVDSDVAEQAIAGLNNLDIGGQSIMVQRAPAAAPTESITNFMQTDAAENDIPTPVLRLGNMVQPEELEKDEEVEEITEDVREECGRYGEVVSIAIPLPKDSDSASGLGKIFVEFSSESHAQAASKALSGRSFGGNTVEVTYYPYDKFKQKVFEG